MDKEEIIKFIDDSCVSGIINDCKTFVSAKTKSWEGYGGGNFLCGIGLFSVLNILSKIHSILKGKELYSHEDKKSFKIATEECNHVIKNYCQPPRLNNLKQNEAASFVELYNDTQNKIKWGLNNAEEADIFWRNYRNKLAHLAFPYAPIAALSTEQLFGKNTKEILYKLRLSDQKIYDYHSSSSPEQKCISIEICLLELEKLWQIIKQKIDGCDDPKIIMNIELLLTS